MPEGVALSYLIERAMEWQEKVRSIIAKHRSLHNAPDKQGTDNYFYGTFLSLWRPLTKSYFCVHIRTVHIRLQFLKHTPSLINLVTCQVPTALFDFSIFSLHRSKRLIER